MKVLTLLALLSSSLLSAHGQDVSVPVNINVDPGAPGLAVPVDFQGLSFGIDNAQPNSDGIYYFSEQNEELIHLLNTLGVRILRMGPSGRPLNQEANDHLLKFAQAAHIKLLYGLNMADPDPQTPRGSLVTPAEISEEAETVVYLTKTYPGMVEGYCFGNEPNSNPKYALENKNIVVMGNAVNPGYSTFERDWSALHEALLAQIRIKDPAISMPSFFGPSAVPNFESWSINFSNFISRRPTFRGIEFVSQHEYPFGGGQALGTPALKSNARKRMLADTGTRYASLWNNETYLPGDPRIDASLHNPNFASTFFIPYMLANKTPFRLEETNSYCNHGCDGVSNAFASALWGLDYEYWWAAHHATGLNFMTGFNRNDTESPLAYSAFNSHFVKGSSRTSEMALGLGYAMTAFKLGSSGRLIQCSVQVPDLPIPFNFSAYTVLGSDGFLYVTVLNKDNLDYTPSVREARVTLNLPIAYRLKSVQCCELTCHSLAGLGDVSSTSGITLGGFPIDSQGNWSGAFSQGAPSFKHTEPNSISISIPAASANVLKLQIATP